MIYSRILKRGKKFGTMSEVDKSRFQGGGERKIIMADSNITKNALALALRELMEEAPIEKINVTHICERCGMNRKSFYYHFKDKYDLINWIYDTEFRSLTEMDLSSTDGRLSFVEQACKCFYENRAFYRKALKLKGQNSFAEHFRESLGSLLKKRLEQIMTGDKVDDFSIDFYTDACLGAIERWLLDQDCMPPEQFLEKMTSLIQASNSIVGE